jgi:hypothetical protein
MTDAYFGSLVCFFMVNISARLEINNFWEETNRRPSQGV